ncbi:hypothetical protein BS47DRAFT_1338816 [Hydnum rufescens UP504]|uniref:Protein kinase domain-containing protein n=1 Tax=Hydnum rufescens UP504 TaxID=1448309 RepID=A0A9P6E0K6_9AGAM|nr:hypothetical protein BS47DRAFT_1338816 [Hydnum rufescens UP504]
MDSFESTVPIQVYRGDHATIYKGVRAGRTVAIKIANVGSARVERINRESKIGQRLNHRNIVPFLGCCGPRHELPYMVSEWMPNGNARVYASKDADENVDCIRIVRPSIELCVHFNANAAPLPSVETDDQTCRSSQSNILIDADGTARIPHFALEYISGDVQTGSRPPPMRWSAPEVLEGDNHEVSSDMYSYACVILEIITDTEPFSKYNHLYRLHRLIREGLRPEFPQSELAWRRGLTNPVCALWKLMHECWAAHPDRRPTAVQARDRMLEIWSERRARARVQGAGGAIPTVI